MPDICPDCGQSLESQTEQELMGNCPGCGADLTPKRISDRLRTVNLPNYAGPGADDDEIEKDQPEILVVPKGVGPDLDAGSIGKTEDTRLPSPSGPPIERPPSSDVAGLLEQLLDNTGHEDVPPPEPEALLSRVSLLEGMRKCGLDGEDLIRAAGLLRSAFGLVLVAVPPSREGTATGTVFSELSNRTTEPARIACLVVKDLESGKQAIHMAIRGNLVFTLLEAGDSRGAMLRLDSDLQVDRVLFAASLRGVIAERPLRTICDSCREPCEPEKDTRSALRLDGTEGPFFHGAGCASCDYTGYKGEAAIYETLSMNRPLRDMLGRGESGDRVWTAALHSGELRSFREAGIEALRVGATSPMELVRVLNAS
jgi:hypothetical protein